MPVNEKQVQRFVQLLDRSVSDPGPEGAIAAVRAAEMEAAHPELAQVRAQWKAQREGPQPQWSPPGGAYNGPWYGPSAPPPGVQPQPPGATFWGNMWASLGPAAAEALRMAREEAARQDVTTKWKNQHVKVSQRVDKMGALRVEVVIPDAGLQALRYLPGDPQSVLEDVADAVAEVARAEFIRALQG